MSFRPVVLAILDGFGVPPREAIRQSPFTLAHMETIHDFEKWYPFTTLQASGTAVGLPPREPGNSEVGHLTIGAGRPVLQHLPRITDAIRKGNFNTIPAFNDVIAQVKKNGGTLHLVGLYSQGIVHSSKEHVHALINLAVRSQIPTLLHVFTDGRDAAPHEGLDEVKNLLQYLEQTQATNVRIGSISGRMIAMDRDKNWERTRLAYDMLVGLPSPTFQFPAAYIASCYEKGLADGFIPPARTGFFKGINDGDGIIFWDFREDRMRQLVHAFVDEKFEAFARTRKSGLTIATLTEYEAGLNVRVAFPKLTVDRPLASVLSSSGKTQLHVAETEKYAHVTYFFNGGREEPYKGEERILVPSKKVETYDLLPTMSASEVTDAVLAHVGGYDVVIVNYANPDMVGHTGNVEATITAIETVDKELARLSRAVEDMGGVLLVTADHGNSEEKRSSITGELRTWHTINAVPFYVIGKAFRRTEALHPDEIAARYVKASGMLTDVAPTLLDLVGIPVPGYMTGKSLLHELTQ